MLPAYLRGPIANVFTAFNEDLTFDSVGQRAILDALVETGAVSAYFVRSGMGQMYTFDIDDVKAITRVACGHLENIGPVLVGVSGIWDRRPESRRANPALDRRRASPGVSVEDPPADHAPCPTRSQRTPPATRRASHTSSEGGAATARPWSGWCSGARHGSTTSPPALCSSPMTSRG